MGKQTGPIIVGFLCAHIATVLNIVGLVEPFWLIGNHNGTTNNTLSPSKGLWKFCLDSGNCTSLKEHAGNGTGKCCSFINICLSI